MSSLDGVFNGSQEVTDAAEEKTVSEKTAAKKMLTAALKDTVSSDPSYQSKVRSISASLEVTNSLGYGKNGNIIQVNKGVKGADGKMEGRELKPTSKVVGYRVKNIGATPISYQTESFKKDETGKYVGEVVTKVIAPGKSADLARKYFTIFTAQPEVSFTLNNGVVIGPVDAKEKNFVKLLERYHFKFTGDDAKSINDDTVKLAIDNDGVIKAEFVETFGNLMNPKEARQRPDKIEEGSKFTAQDKVANFINRKINEMGI